MPSAPATGATARSVLRSMIRFSGGTAVAVTLMACYGAPPFDDPCSDQDGDGYFPACYGESCDPADPYCDCDDSDETIHPDASDLAGDGVDTDCDGEDGARPK